MTPPRPARALAVAATLLALAASCGGDGDAATTTTVPPTTATTTTRPPTTEPPSEEAAILAAVEGYWQTIREANSEPLNPDHPGFEDFFSDGPGQTSRAVVHERLELGQAVRYKDESPYRHELELRTLDGGSAVVIDCAVDDSVLYEVGSGRVLNDAIGTFLWEIRLVDEHGRWRVANSTILDRWEGVAGCAAG